MLWPTFGLFGEFNVQLAVSSVSQRFSYDMSKQRRPAKAYVLNVEQLCRIHQGTRFLEDVDPAPAPPSSKKRPASPGVDQVYLSPVLRPFTFPRDWPMTPSPSRISDVSMADSSSQPLSPPLFIGTQNAAAASSPPWRMMDDENNVFGHNEPPITPSPPKRKTRSGTVTAASAKAKGKARADDFSDD